MPQHLDHDAAAGPSIPSPHRDDLMPPHYETMEQSSSHPPIRLLAQHALRRHDTPAGPQSTMDDRTRPGETIPARHSSPDTTPRPFYTSAQWTADGTSLIAASSAQAVSSFVLPADLLQPSGAGPRALQPQSILLLPEPTQVVAPAPYFSLADPSSQHLLVGCRDHPLQLYHLFPNTTTTTSGKHDADADACADVLGTRPAPLSSYKLIRKESEQYITPASLLWQRPGTHFICGSSNRLDCFDISRPGSDGPLLTIPTIPSRRHISKGHGVGMKGTVAALAASPADAGTIAAGTWTRWMGLYDIHRTDRVVANWSVASAAEAAFPLREARIGGQGIVQTAWSPCGRYLLINERHAQGMLVYDIRVTGQLLSVLAGRPASSQQRLRCDVFSPGEDGSSGRGGGFEVWAGCQDGRVAVWEAVGAINDVQDPAWSWAAHDSPVGSAAVHPSGSVVASCSGGWGHPPPDDIARGTAGLLSVDSLSDARVFDESSLKIWCLE